GPGSARRGALARLEAVAGAWERPKRSPGTTRGCCRGLGVPEEEPWHDSTLLQGPGSARRGALARLEVVAGMQV
ncbi:hypothetical protein CYMTET_26720, partial [Cymbomonas tetramitiformis]